MIFGGVFAAANNDWIFEYHNGKEFFDARARKLINANVPLGWSDEVFDRMSIPPSMDTIYGDSVVIFESCKFQSCFEEMAFLYDVKRSVGLFYEADKSDSPSRAMVISKICTRDQYERLYRHYFEIWVIKNNIKIHDEVFWLRPTEADTELESLHQRALQAYKDKASNPYIDSLLKQTERKPWSFGNFNLVAYNDLGFFLEQANRSAEAIPVLEKVIAFDPSRTPAYLNLADAYAKAGDKAKAKEKYQKYVELMEQTGKGSKVPARVHEFLKN
jgi:tetratricopeptide (TPR) repeat protein